jgi:hypothetical protein
MFYSQHRFIPALVALALVFATIWSGVIHAAPASVPSGQSSTFTCLYSNWRTVKSPSPAHYTIQFRGLAAISSNDIWAVGSQETGNPPIQTLAEHWNGTAWSVVPTPNASTPGVGTGQNELLAVAGSATTDVWAVGDYNDLSTFTVVTLIEHWNGATWSVVTSPNVMGAQDTILKGVIAISSNNAWAVGYSTTQNVYKSLIEHWDGSTWSMVTAPSTGQPEDSLNGISALAADDIWAVGSGSGKTLAEHWNGSTWSVVASPNASTNTSFSAVSAGASNNIWAVGFSYDTTSQRIKTMTEHWNGTAWTLVPSSSPGSADDYLFSVVATAPNDAWAVGQMAQTVSGGQVTLIEHWNGTSWTVDPGGLVNSNFAALYAVTATSPSNVWAGGFYVDSSSDFELTLAEHYPSAYAGPRIHC